VCPIAVSKRAAPKVPVSLVMPSVHAMKTKVLLVDEHTMFREALHLMLEKDGHLHVVGEVTHGSQVEAAVARLAPDVVVMDVSMPEVNGIEVTHRLVQNHPTSRVVALSAHHYRQFVMEMMDAGATAYVVKSSAVELLVRAIQSAARGEIFLCPTAAQALLETVRSGFAHPAPARSATQRLGRRERQVLSQLANGKSSPQIAEALHIATSTVDVHRRNIMNKLELHTIAELTKYAVRVGLSDL